MATETAVEVRCPRASCRRYVFSVPAGTPFHAFCLGCGLKWAGRA